MSHWSRKLEKFAPCSSARKHMLKYKHPKNALKHTQHAEWLVWVLAAYEVQNFKIRLLDIAKNYLYAIEDDNVHKYVVGQWESLVEPYYPRFQPGQMYELHLDIWSRMRHIDRESVDYTLLDAVACLCNSSMFSTLQHSNFLSGVIWWIGKSTAMVNLEYYRHNQMAMFKARQYFADWAKAQPEWDQIIEGLTNG